MAKAEVGGLFGVFVVPDQGVSDETPAFVSLTGLHSTEECESGRIGTTGNRVLGNQPWVQIPPPPLSGLPDRALGSPMS